MIAKELILLFESWRHAFLSDISWELIPKNGLHSCFICQLANLFSFLVQKHTLCLSAQRVFKTLSFAFCFTLQSNFESLASVSSPCLTKESEAKSIGHSPPLQAFWDWNCCSAQTWWKQWCVPLTNSWNVSTTQWWKWQIVKVSLIPVQFFGIFEEDKDDCEFLLVRTISKKENFFGLQVAPTLETISNQFTLQTFLIPFQLRDFHKLSAPQKNQRWSPLPWWNQNQRQKRTKQPCCCNSQERLCCWLGQC